MVRAGAGAGRERGGKESGLNEAAALAGEGEGVAAGGAVGAGEGVCAALSPRGREEC
jgi:hypothetical protein